MPAHTIPVNLPKDNETKEQFLTRSGKILMKTGKSKEESQKIAENIWDRHISQDVRFTPFNAGQGVRWTANRGTKLDLGAAPPPIHMTQQGHINDAMRMSNVGRMPQAPKSAGGSSLGDIGLGKFTDSISRNMNELIKGHQKLIEQATQSNQYLEEILTETRSIRSQGHKIRVIRPPSSPPRSQDLWNMDKGLNIGFLRHPNITKMLPPELVKPLRVLDMILNPVQAGHQFVERKVKGFTGKILDMLNGPMLTQYQRDPRSLAKDAGVKMLEKDELKDKVISKILPEKFEEVTDLQREQLDVLRNLYSVTKDNHEATTGKSHEYQRTVGAQERVFDPATGMYMDKKKYDTELKKRTALINRHLNFAKRASLGGLLNLGVQGLGKSFGLGKFTKDIDISEKIEGFHERAFGTRRDHSDKNLKKLALQSTYDDEGVEDLLQKHLRQQVRQSRRLDSVRGGSIKDWQHQIWNFLNGGKFSRTAIRSERPADPDFDPNVMFAGPNVPGANARRRTEQEIGPYNIENIMTNRGMRGSAGGIGGWSPPPTPGQNTDMSATFIQSVKLVDIEKDLFEAVEKKGGLPVKVLPNPLPVLTEGSVSADSDRDKQERKRKKKKMREESRVWHHSGIETVGGPAHRDNIPAVLQKGEKVIAKGKSIKMDVATAATAESTAELVEMEKRRPPLSQEVAKGLKIAAEEGYGVGGSGRKGKRTLGDELKEVAAEKAKSNEENYKKNQLTKQDRMIKLLEEVRDKKLEGPKKEEEEGFLSKLLKGGLAALLPMIAPLLGALAAGGALALGINALSDKIGVGFKTIMNFFELIMGIVGKVASKLGLGKAGELAAKAAEAAKTAEGIGKGAEAASKVGTGVEAVAKAASELNKGTEVAAKGAEVAKGAETAAKGTEGASKASKVGSFVSKAWDSTKAFASTAYNAAAESKAGQFVSKVVKTVKGAFSSVSEALGGVFEAGKNVFTKVIGAYNSLKSMKYIGPIVKGLQTIMGWFVKAVNILLNNKIVLGAFRVLGAYEMCAKLVSVAWNWNDDSALVSALRIAHVVVKFLNCRIMKAMYLAVGATGVGATVSIPWMLTVMGLDYLLEWIIDYLSKSDTDKKNLEQSKEELPEDLKKKMESNPDQVSPQEAQSELPQGFAELDPGTDSSKKKASTASESPSLDDLPMMHSGGIVKPTPSEMSRLGDLGGRFSGAAGYVDQEDGETGDNLNRTLQRGEYVMTKGETKSLTQIMDEIRRIMNSMQRDVGEIAIDVHRMRKYADEAEERRKQEEENHQAGLDKYGNPLQGGAGAGEGSGSGAGGGGLWGSVKSFFGFGGDASKQGTRGPAQGNKSEKPGEYNFGEQGGRGSVDSALSKDQQSQLQALQQRGDLGALTELGETGSLKGKIDMVSDGMKGRDKGGVSYGLYQFSSQTGGVDALIKAGLNSSDEKHQRFAKRLQAVQGDATSNTGQFAQTWKTLAQEDPEAFKAFQEKGFSKGWYDPVVEGLKKRGIDVDSRSKAFKSMIWSMSAQHGPQGALNVLDKAWGKDAAKLTDADMISKAYDERYAMDSPDKMRYFREGTPIKGLKARHEREKNLALGMLNSENANTAAAPYANTPNFDSGSTAGKIDTSKLGVPGGGPVSTEEFNKSKDQAQTNASKFYSPIQGRQITSGFGARNVPGGSKNHQAIDIKYKEGESVSAMSGGEVSKIGSNYIEIKQPDGYTARYMHIHPPNLKVGQKIEPGQAIGTIKTEGTGSHLDFQVRDPSGKPVHPEKYLETKYQENGMEYKPSYQSAASNKYKPGESGTGSPVGPKVQNAVYNVPDGQPSSKSPDSMSKYIKTGGGFKVSGQSQGTNKQMGINQSAVAFDEALAGKSGAYSQASLSSKYQPRTGEQNSFDESTSANEIHKRASQSRQAENTYGYQGSGNDSTYAKTGQKAMSGYLKQYGDVTPLNPQIEQRLQDVSSRSSWIDPNTGKVVDYGSSKSTPSSNTWIDPNTGKSFDPNNYPRPTPPPAQASKGFRLNTPLGSIQLGGGGFGIDTPLGKLGFGNGGGGVETRLGGIGYDKNSGLGVKTPLGGFRVGDPNSRLRSGLSNMPLTSTETTMDMMNNSAAVRGGRQAAPGDLGRLDTARLENGYSSTKASTVETSEAVTKDREGQKDQPPIVLPPQQVPMTVNPNSNKASMAQMQDRKIDLTSSTMIEKIFQNTIVSFMTLATDFALGNKSTTVFKNSFSA